MLPDCTGNFADRMPIVVSGLNVEKLLAIPILPASTGELIGNAVVETFREWQGVPEYLAGLCFDRQVIDKCKYGHPYWCNNCHPEGV